jgi:hypothetical protein
MEEEISQEKFVIEEIDEVLEELDIYTEEGMESYVDDDCISPIEEGFMQGYLDA